MADYILKALDTAGDLQGIVTDFASLSYLRKVNAPGLLQVGLRGDHPLLATLGDKWQMEVWRKPDGGSFAREFVGLVRQQEYYYGDRSTAIVTCPGLMSMLAWRIVAWPASTSNRTKFVAQPGETIMKALVTYNATSSASVVNGRIRAGAIAGLSVEADGAHGASLDWFCAYESLLDALQKLAPVAGGDFDVVKLTSTTWQFRWYTGQLGSDRSTTVIFALPRGNMANPRYKDLRVDEKTICIVGGQGEGAARAIAVRIGDNYNTSNDIEMFANGSSSDTTAGLQSQGDATLADNRAKQQFGFDVLQTPATRYGVHYDLGDLVTAVNPFTGSATTMKVDEVSISVGSDGAERVDVKMVIP